MFLIKKLLLIETLRLDGIAGSDTQDALKRYMSLRGSDGVDTLQGATVLAWSQI